MIDQAKIHNQCLNDDPKERVKALEQIRINFSLLPDKQQAWDDLIKRIYDKDIPVNVIATFALCSVFSKVLDKQQAWNDLVKLTSDKNWLVRSYAADALGSLFSQLPDKQQAWDELVKLTSDKYWLVRFNAAKSLGSVFSQMPEKQETWDYLHSMTNDKDSLVRRCAANALCSVFSKVPDKQQLWEDLIKLTSDKNQFVRSNATNALSSVFSQLPDKQQAWDELIRLTNDEDSYVRTIANYSLGKISIFQASQAEQEENYKNELEKAIEYFEKAALESTDDWLNPSQFCLPFYRSFHTIIFNRQEAKEELSKYIEEAKDAVRGSKNKELLFEVVENLAKALEEVQNLGNIGLEEKKSELNFYRKYCERAAELMNDTSGDAPYATEVLKKGFPILDRNLKELIEKIHKKAKIACKESLGSATEEIACAISKEVQKWEVSNQEEMTQRVEDVAYMLKTKVADIPENEYILSKIEAMRYERNLNKQYETFILVIGLISTVKVVSEQELDQKLDQKLEKFNHLYDEIVIFKEKLNCMSFNISNIGINSSNVISMLSTIKTDVEKLNRISQKSMDSEEASNSKLTEQLTDLNEIFQGRLDELEKSIICLPQNDKTIEILNKLSESKQAKFGDLIQTPASVATLIGFAIQIIQLCQQYKLV